MLYWISSSLIWLVILLFSLSLWTFWLNILKLFLWFVVTTWLFKSSEKIAEAIISLFLFFFTIQRILIVFGRCLFFKLLFRHFHDFWSQTGEVILVTPEQEGERKSKWFCSVIFFHSQFNFEWQKCIWTKDCFLSGGLLFTCGNFTLIFCYRFFFDFLDRIFFLNAFTNSFKNVSEQKIAFFLVVCCSHAAISLWFFVTVFFSIFLDRIFFLNAFTNSFILLSMPSFLFERNFSFSLEVFCSHVAFWILRQDLSC